MSLPPPTLDTFGSETSSGLWTSWNATLSCRPKYLAAPADLTQLSSMVSAADRVRVFGSGKSSADNCRCDDTMISLQKLDRILYLGPDPQRPGFGLVEAEAGISLSRLLEELEAAGWCIPALPDIDNISLGGAVATGTHGTGHQALTLSDYVVGLRLVDAAGQKVECGRCPADLEGFDSQDIPIDALKVSMGMLGVMYSICLGVEALFNLALEEKPVSDRHWLANWQDWQEAYDFTRVLFIPHAGRSWAILGKRFETQAPFAPLPPGPDIARRREVSNTLYQAAGSDGRKIARANRQMAKRFFSQPVRRLGSLYRSTVTSSRSGTMVLGEWTIAFSRFDECFRELNRRINRFVPVGVHLPMDVRFLRKGEAWLGNNWEADTVTLGCVCRVVDLAGDYRPFGIMEETFLAHGGRPHWAKTFKADGQTLEKLYPRMADFIALRRTLDPRGKFLNPWLESLFT